MGTEAGMLPMHIEEIELDKLNPDPSNLRQHPARNIDAIKASLARFGQVKPIVVDEANVIRAGNGTYEAAKALGWNKLRCVRTWLKGSEATAYAIADNRTTDLSAFDEPQLAEMLKQLQGEGIDLDAIGFTAKEIDALSKTFDPVGLDEQSRLDEKSKVTCPECGHSFAP